MIDPETVLAVLPDELKSATTVNAIKTCGTKSA